MALQIKCVVSIRLDLNVTVDNLRQFLRRRSNVKIVLKDCLEEFDEYAKKFMETMERTSKYSTEMNAFMNDVERKATLLEPPQVR